jgi:hypothetical protein
MSDVLAAESNVFLDGGIEQNRLLRYHSDQIAQPFQIERRDQFAIHSNLQSSGGHLRGEGGSVREANCYPHPSRALSITDNN